MMYRPTSPAPTALLASLCLLLAACGDDETSSPTASVAATTDATSASDTPPAADVAPTDTPTPDTGPLATPDVPGPPSPNVLSFKQETGDDGGPCLSICNRRLPTGGAIDLAVAYRDASGAALDGWLVAFTVVGEAPGTTPSALSTYTTPDGSAGITLSANVDATGTAQIEVTVPDDPAAGKLTFLVDVFAQERPPLKVGLSHAGEAQASPFEIRLYRTDDDGAPSCAALHPDVPVTPLPADAIFPSLAPNKDATFESLPGLLPGDTQTWTIVAIGPGGGFPLAYGCIEGVAVEYGKTASVVVEAVDLPIAFGERYDLSSRFDLVTGLDGTLGSALETIFGLFTEPGRVAIEAACTNASGTLGQVCGFLTDSQGNLSATGLIVATAADEAFFYLTKESLGVDVEFTGQQLRALLQNTRVRSELTVSAQAAAANGEGGSPGFSSEIWKEFVFFWTYGIDCPPGGGPCGQVVLPLEQVYGLEPSASFQATVDSDLALTIPVHEVPDFKFGPLVNTLIERAVLPRLFGDGDSGLPAIDSYEDLVATLLGDKYCLAYDDCCEYFATKLEGEIPDILLPAVPTACELAIVEASDWLRALLLDISSPLTIGTPDGTPCGGDDLVGQRVVTHLGTINEPCVWDASFVFGQDTPFHPDNDWYGAINTEVE